MLPSPFLVQPPDEAAFARAAVPIPEVAHANGPPPWTLYTAKADPSTVRAALDRILSGRDGWERTPLGWDYDSHAHFPLNSTRLGIEVLRGRAMPRREALPQTEVWTTVRLIRFAMAGSQGMAFDGWTLATRLEDDESLNAPVGEERFLPGLVGLPLVEHRTRFGVPRWTFADDVSMGEAIKRVDRALARRPGWRGTWPIGIVGESGKYPTFWYYRPIGTESGPPLDLSIENGRVLGDRDHRACGATVRVVAQTPRLG